MRRKKILISPKPKTKPKREPAVKAKQNHRERSGEPQIMKALSPNWVRKNNPPKATRYDLAFEDSYDESDISEFSYQRIGS
jgi:hypothetical protein